MASPAEDVMPTREPSIATVSEKNEEQEKNLDEPDRNLDESPPSATAPPPTPAPDVPPNGGYGWVCCAATFWINAHTWGLNSSYGVFLAHYLSNNVFPGATRLDFAFVGGLSISQALFVAPLATMTTRRFGTRVTLLIGVFFETLSLIGASFATEIWQLFLSQGVCFGWGMGFLFVGSVGVTPQWFTTRRSFANGITASGSGLGGLMYSLATNAMIQRIGLDWAFRILGICAFTVNTACALLIKDRNKKIGSSQLAFDYRLFRRPEFLLLLGFGFLSMLGYIVLLFSLPNYAQSGIGLSAHQGSVIGAVLNLGQALGRPPIGYFSDNVGRMNMASVMTFLAGLFSLVIWIFAKTYGVMIFFALVVGMVAGTYWAVVAPVTAEAVGIADLPSALSITWVILVIPTTFSEAIALQITASNHGNYLGAQIFTGFMYIGAAVFLWLLRAWKIGEMEQLAAEKNGSEDSADPVSEHVAEPVAHESNGTVKSNFLKRMVMLKRV
ncbi:MFS transporter [Lasiodiplodia theobromae]|uniref:Putative transporter MCH2 n=1 Tax=Lasiodiplodia theobromae TaxID=45133 RepID=A0A5N5D2M3_9PEZI|nr:MFS transporter [Lasiodiplodia theobromae]KAB2571965.1 putative transporter MCH2 [Lasiodiplodia theobromae]KAF4534281.1 MFS transporter [Lasiodiplodia theobromae]